VIDLLGPEDGAGTALTHEESQGLLLSYITLRSELNAAEQENIADASERARRRKFVLDETCLNRLHGEMFGRVWEWAGAFRTTDKNIGAPYHRIPTDLRQLLDDSRYYVKHNTYPSDELAARFHHRLVYIHPYSNGNGRHARFATDLLLESVDARAFTWGSATGADSATARRRYIEALKAADGHDYRPLLAFVRS
jgi:Fic-DOC domain mobile mystery protein B